MARRYAIEPFLVIQKVDELMSDKISLVLTGFVRRTEHTSQLKALLKASGAQLSRQGRSRNWALVIKAQQVIAVRKAIEEAGQPSWLWLAKKLTSEYPHLSQDELKQFAIQHWPVTVSKLMSLTDCTLAEARLAIDEVEWE